MNAKVIFKAITMISTTITSNNMITKSYHNYFTDHHLAKHRWRSSSRDRSGRERRRDGGVFQCQHHHHHRYHGCHRHHRHHGCHHCHHCHHCHQYHLDIEQREQIRSDERERMFEEERERREAEVRFEYRSII